MKKIVQTALILTLASVTIISCKKKEDPAPNNNNNSSIEGTWNIDSELSAVYINDSLWNGDTTIYAPGAFEISFNGGQSISKNTDTSGTDYDTAAYFITNANELNVVLEMDSVTNDTLQFIFTITNSNKLNLHMEEIYEEMGAEIKETYDLNGTRK